MRTPSSGECYEVELSALANEHDRSGKYNTAWGKDLERDQPLPILVLDQAIGEKTGKSCFVDMTCASQWQCCNLSSLPELPLCSNFTVSGCGGAKRSAEDYREHIHPNTTTGQVAEMETRVHGTLAASWIRQSD